MGNWIVRCFAAQLPTVAPPSDIALRYRVIADYLNRYCASPELSFLVPHIWIEHGVNVKGEALPFVKVPFIPDSQPLGDFLTSHYHDQRITRVLTQQWLEVVRQLEAHQIAHGDLDMTNILVCGQPPNISLKLIDYDGMYVPSLAKYGLGVADNGHAHFQPPRASIRTFGPTMDCFSVLIIYITLSALTSNYALWEDCNASETRPLLGAKDFARLGLSQNFTRLLQEGNNSDLQQCLRELQDAVMHSRMPRNLGDILNSSYH